MKILTIETKEIENLISLGKYEAAAYKIFSFLENTQNHLNKEQIYEALTLLNLICDKSSTISLQISNIIELFVNDSDSWIRLEALEIIYQLTLYRPNLLLDLIEAVRNRLFDKDNSVRRLAVKIIGNLILSLHIDEDYLHELIEEFTEKLMDNDWKVKFHVIKTIQKILNQDYTKIRDLEPLLSIVIINLRDEDDDVARSAAELLKLLGTYFLSKDKIFYVLLNLLYNEKPRVKELIIWLFGEIGKERSSEIIPIIPKLIRLLKEDDFRIQIKVTDALVNISENNFDQIWSNLLNSLDTSDYEYKNNIINALYHLGKKNIPDIFPYLFQELESPSKNIQEAIALVFQRLFEEYQIDIENEITKIIYNLESKYWRERKNTITLLRNICFILNTERIAVWIKIELTKALNNEKDPDVIEEFRFTFSKIDEKFDNIQRTIIKINKELEVLNESIVDFQKIPAQFRKTLDSYIREFKFNETELKVNKYYNKVLKDINTFHRRINNFEYKRIAFDLIEEWDETKIQIIDELSIIKGFILEICEDKKAEFLDVLKTKIKLLDDRINVLKVNFDYVRNYEFELVLPDGTVKEILMEQANLEEKFAIITNLRKNLFKLDVDIRELLLNNIEFNEIFKGLLKKWIATKIKIQKYLGDLDRQIRLLKEEIIRSYKSKEIEFDISQKTEEVMGVNNELAIQILQSNIQAIMSNGIEGFKKINDNFNQLNAKFEYFLKRNKYVQAKKLIKMQSTQTQTFIEDIENQIENVIGKEKIHNNIFDLYARPYIDKWNVSKELLINKLKFYIRKSREKLYLTQFKNYLKIVNPIKFKLLSSYVGLDVEQMKELVLKFIKKNQLKAKIVNDTLFSPKIETEIPTHKELLFFKNIKTLRNKFYLNFKLSNPSNYKYRDLQISLQVPKYLKFERKESFPSFMNLSEIKPGKSFKFHYVLKIDKILKRNISNPSVDEIKLGLHYRDPFDINRRMTKKIDLIFP
ncbi:MAG: PCI domain-containing protein [Promethearchaeota archaeon]